MNNQTHKPAVETIINTAALALTSFGVAVITKNGAGWEFLAKGFLLVCFGAGLEFFKYWGRKEDYW